MSFLIEPKDIQESFFIVAEKEAKKSTCLRRNCGAVLVKDNRIIGRGFNSPPGNLESQRRCHINRESLDSKVTDTTCCVHAERRAISNALKRGNSVRGATMYFTSIDKNGKRLLSGKPYCTDCSKMSLDEGIAAWVLEHESGFIYYDAEEYNEISFNYKG
ncbi:MAG: deaminase [Nanoarchaeota archaeon]